MNTETGDLPMTMDEFEKWIDEYAYEGQTLLVRILQKYNCDKEYEDLTELLFIEENDGKNVMVWDNDWWEGQQDVNIYGCMKINDVKIPIGHFNC